MAVSNKRQVASEEPQLTRLTALVNNRDANYQKEKKKGKLILVDNTELYLA